MSFDPKENMRAALANAERLVKNIHEKHPPIYRIMASPLVPWPRTFRQWDAKGRLLVWINADAVKTLPVSKRTMIDMFTSIDVVSIPVEFVG